MVVSQTAKGRPYAKTSWGGFGPGFIWVAPEVGGLSLYAQLFRSDETTPLSNEVLVASVSSSGSFANTAAIALTGLDTSASKTVWDAAKIRFRWG